MLCLFRDGSYIKQLAFPYYCFLEEGGREGREGEVIFHVIIERDLTDIHTCFTWDIGQVIAQVCGVLSELKGEGNTLHTGATLPNIPCNKVFITLVLLRISLADSTGQYNPGNMEKFLLSAVLLGNTIRKCFPIIHSHTVTVHNFI